MAVKIHFTVAGSGSTVILLHGLFGMSSNLGALARSLADRYEVYSVDLPNHGESGWETLIDIPTMAQYLLAWMAQQGIEHAALVGHSLGGKVAMAMALSRPELILGLVVADIAPVRYGVGHQREFEALQAVAGAAPASRGEAAQIMAKTLDNPMVIQFLLKSLTRQQDGSYAWRFNLAGLLASYEAARAGLATSSVYAGPVLFIKGGLSDYIETAHQQTIMALFPAAQLKVMPDCGHWLHAENPRLFNSLVGRFLDATFPKSA